MQLKDKVVDRLLDLKPATAVLLAAAVSAVTVSFPVYAMSKQFSIVNGCGETETAPCKKNIAEVLAKEGIMLSEADVTSPTMALQHQGDSTHIGNAKNINSFDSETFDKLTAKTHCSLGLFGNKNENYSDFEMVITKECKIPYNSVRRETTELRAGQHRIAQMGADGTGMETYRITSVNGLILNVEPVSTEVTVPPVDEIVEYGADAATAYHGGRKISRGQELRYKQVLTVTATAYDLGFSSCGKKPGDKGYGITASGMYARRGCVAVDPNVIPLGTRLYIEAPDGSWTYGNAIAADTGGAVKGNKIDLFMDTYSECINFGRRSAVVYVLE